MENSENNAGDKNYWRISVRVRGVKKKCRKEDAHTFRLATIPHVDKDQLDMSHWQSVARSMVESNMKNYSGKMQLDFVFMTIGKDFEQWQMFDKRHFMTLVETPVMAEIR
jgi:hypothetical protein